MATDELSNPSNDRRRHPRVATRRPVLFSSDRERAVIAPGETIDIGLTGLQLRSHAPVSVGSAVDIELQSRFPEGECRPILVRGRVVHTRPSDRNEFRIGIRLEAPSLRSDSTPLELETVQSNVERLIEKAIGQLKNGYDPRRPPIAFLTISHDTGEARPPDSRPSIRTRHAPRAAWFLLAAALVFVFALWLYLAPQGPFVRNTGDGGEGYRTSNASGTWSPERDFDGGIPPNSEADAAGGDENRAMAFRLLAADEKHVAARMSESTPQRLAEVTGFLAKSGLDEISGEFGQLQALAAFDRVEQAGVVLESIRESYSQWPRPWRDAAGQLERAIEVRDEAAVAALRFRSAFQLDSAPKEFMHVRSLVVPASGQPIEGLDAVPRGIWLHVSKRDYVLTVYRHDTPLRQFPVGLGQDESTPEGVFHIANRIPNPDWYDHGRTVKAGDPGNPLGSRWMGLGNTSGPTPYGIHPTNDSGSIGANRSRGCIRMRSADAERLFNLCTVGVPVIITGK